MKILCAVDGSEFSSWAIQALGALFHQSLKEVVLFHVIDTTHLKEASKKGKPDAVHLKQVMSAMEREGEKILKACKQKASVAISQAVTKPFSAIRTVLAKGHVADIIIKQAEKRKPDLVVIGSRGLSDIRGYLLGSVSRKVLSHAPCAVLTIKGPMPSEAHAVMAVDGSKASTLAANKVKQWTSPESVSIHILSVVPDILTDIAPKVLPKTRVKALTEPFHIRARELAAQYREFFLKDEYEVTTEVLNGNPRDMIVENIERKKGDLAILGSKGLTGSERFQMGSVSEWVAAYAACSVLVIRPRPA